MGVQSEAFEQDLRLSFLCFRVCVSASVRANVCEMEQMALRPRVCVIEKSPYVFAGLTKCKHTMLQREEKHERGRRTVNTKQICF